MAGPDYIVNNLTAIMMAHHPGALAVNVKQHMHDTVHHCAKYWITPCIGRFLHNLWCASAL